MSSIPCLAKQSEGIDTHNDCKEGDHKKDGDDVNMMKRKIMRTTADDDDNKDVR